jgi:hypothetical protein
MRRVMRTQIDVVLDEGAGVLNADLPEVADLAELCDGEVISTPPAPTMNLSPPRQHRSPS